MLYEVITVLPDEPGATRARHEPDEGNDVVLVDIHGQLLQARVAATKASEQNPMCRRVGVRVVQAGAEGTA